MVWRTHNKESWPQLRSLAARTHKLMQALETNVKKAVGNQILNKIYCRAVSSSTFAENMEVGLLYVTPMCIYVSREGSQTSSF